MSHKYHRRAKRAPHWLGSLAPRKRRGEQQRFLLQQRGSGGTCDFAWRGWPPISITCAAGFAPCGPSHSDHSRNSHVGYLSAQGDEGGNVWRAHQLTRPSPRLRRCILTQRARWRDTARRDARLRLHLLPRSTCGGSVSGPLGKISGYGLRVLRPAVSAFPEVAVAHRPFRSLLGVPG